ncbi:Uncharacterized damage-inducible protein DinB (forms a four-helix bundle) [Paenibacillaceae bacterium GAS479]|nr:Uncharacterized damage-inducible protein DinB (forms a four-helix bundle) [Paenibacillaceae bacterium GAS479]
MLEMELFPYRNDVRKVLIPYLKNLNEDQWTATNQGYPNNIAWVISHIALSEDHWVNQIGLKGAPVLAITSTSLPQEILAAYVDIRKQIDEVLRTISQAELLSIIQVPEFSDGWAPPSTPTWRWLFHHVFTHEAYHAGQIGMIARLNGFKGPLF